MEKVVLTVDASDYFETMARAKKAASDLARRFMRDDATWEPHDWSEW